MDPSIERQWHLFLQQQKEQKPDNMCLLMKKYNTTYNIAKKLNLILIQPLDPGANL